MPLLHCMLTLQRGHCPCQHIQLALALLRHPRPVGDLLRSHLCCYAAVSYVMLLLCLLHRFLPEQL